ncbi:MAG: hypothetical protein AMXMBFR47_41750 [Planctomycetota bacterium]
MWFWWDAYSRARLEAKIAALKAAGEPTRVEDFPLPSVADELNAARALSEALACMILSIDPALPSIDDLPFYELELSRGLFEYLDALLALNRESLCLIREARELRTSNGTRFGIGTTPLASHRRFAKLEMAAVLHAHVRLDDAQAIDHLRDGMAVAWIVSNGAPPSVINELIGASIDAMVCEVISSISADILVTKEPIDGNGSASRGQVVSVIEELLSESSVRERMRRAFQMNRIESHTNIVQMADGVGASAPLGMRLIGPSLRIEGCAVLDLLQEVSFAVVAENPIAERGRVTAWSFDEEVGGVERLGTTLRRMANSDPEIILQLQAARLVQRRLAATALAIRLFQVDHGRRPEHLAELIPDYLPAVPIDPFRSDSGPIGYRLEKGRSRLYSVGSDGKDDGGVRPTSGGYRKEIILMIDPSEELPNPSDYYFPALLDNGGDEP